VPHVTQESNPCHHAFEEIRPSNAYEMKERPLRNRITRLHTRKRLFIVGPRKMDADTRLRQRENVSVKSNCYRTAAQSELIPAIHYAFTASSALTRPAQRDNFPTPTKLQIHLLPFVVLLPFLSLRIRNCVTSKQLLLRRAEHFSSDAFILQCDASTYKSREEWGI
jgi:hypothetical protein